MSNTEQPADTVSFQVYVNGWNSALEEVIDLADEIFLDATSDKQRKQINEIIGFCKLAQDYYGLIKDGVRTERANPRITPRFKESE
jgi:hypothetical protein